MGLAVSHGFVWLVTLSTFVRLLSYALCIASLPKIEKTIATEAGQFQLRGGLIIPGIGFLLTLWLISYSTIDNFLIRSEEHTSELQSLMRSSYAVFCLKKKRKVTTKQIKQNT